MLYRLLVFWHRWVGLGMAAFLVVVGLTGSMLAFRSRLDAVFNPELHSRAARGVKPLDLATLAERVEQIEPRVRAGYFAVEDDQVLIAVGPRIDPATGAYYPMEAIGFDHIVLDPSTGAELGRFRDTRVVHGGLEVMNFVYNLHTSLVLGNGGAWALGVVALAWTLDCFAALWLTLPRGKGPFGARWKNAWQVKWKASAFRVNFDLHRAGGLWTWLLVLGFAWSSVMLGPLRTFYETVTRVTLGMESDDALMSAYMLPKPIEEPRLTWREAQAAGERYMAREAASHGFRVTRPYGLSYIPQFGLYTYGVRTTADIRGHGWDTGVWVDAQTGALRRTFFAQGRYAGDTFSNFLWGVHYGDLRDFLPYRILVAIFGAVLVMLSVTGVYIWWKKRRTRIDARKRQTTASATSGPGAMANA